MGEPAGQASAPLKEDPAVEMGLEEGEEPGRKGKGNDFEDREAGIIHDLYARHFVPKKGQEPRKEPLVGSTISSKDAPRSGPHQASGEYQTLPDGSQSKILSQYLGTGVPSPAPADRSSSAQSTQRLSPPTGTGDRAGAELEEFKYVQYVPRDLSAANVTVERAIRSLYERNHTNVAQISPKKETKHGGFETLYLKKAPAQKPAASKQGNGEDGPMGTGEPAGKMNIKEEAARDDGLKELQRRGNSSADLK